MPLNVLSHGELHETAPAQAQLKLYLWKLRFGPRVRELQRAALKKAEFIVIAGDCLRPWFLDGDAVQFSRDLQPRDGDMVICSMLYERSNRQVLGARPLVTTRTAIKQYRVIKGEKWLASADGWVTLEPHRIEGVVVTWHRKGYFRPKVAEMTFGDVPSAPI